MAKANSGLNLVIAEIPESGDIANNRSSEVKKEGAARQSGGLQTSLKFSQISYRFKTES